VSSSRSSATVSLLASVGMCLLRERRPSALGSRVVASARSLTHEPSDRWLAGRRLGPRGVCARSRARLRLGSEAPVRRFSNLYGTRTGVRRRAGRAWPGLPLRRIPWQPPEGGPTPARRGAPTREGGGTDCLGVLVVVPGSPALAGGSSGPFRRIKSGTSVRLTAIGAPWTQAVCGGPSLFLPSRSAGPAARRLRAGERAHLEVRERSRERASAADGARSPRTFQMTSLSAVIASMAGDPPAKGQSRRLRPRASPAGRP
jgi:hypothetical protein